MNDEYQVVDWRLSDPAKSIFKSKNEKAFFSITLCSFPDCPLKAIGKCAMARYPNGSCKYGKQKQEYGYTPRAKKYSQWIRERRESVDGVSQKIPPSKMAIVGDYVWFPYLYWSISKSIPEKYQRDVFAVLWIDKDDFTVDLIQAIIMVRPRALFGGVIQTYQRDVVPVIITHLKEELPEFYNDWANAYPDTAKKFKVISNVGREARLDTIKAGTMVEVKKDVYGLWDGKYIVVGSYKPFFMNIVETAELIITPKKDAVITITNDNQVTSETIFND